MLLGFKFPIPLLHGVMLYFYVSSVTDRFPVKKYILFLHFIPFLITVAYLIPFFLLPAEQKIDIFKNEGRGYETFQLVLILTVFVSGIAYVALSVVLLQKHKKKIRNQFSDLEEINLQWLQFLTYGFGLVWCLVIFTRNDMLIFSGVSIFVILIGFFGFQQRDIFKSRVNPKISEDLEEVTLDIAKPSSEPKKEKYGSSGLSSKLADELHERLNAVMQAEKIYKNSDLSLSDLANNLDTHPNYLSQILNEKEELSFYDYVNTYRVNEFKRLIAIPKNQQFTLLAVAYDCGFNSKSSFNRYFKKCTNQTPSQYVKALQQKS